MAELEVWIKRNNLQNCMLPQQNTRKHRLYETGIEIHQNKTDGTGKTARKKELSKKENRS